MKNLAEEMAKALDRLIHDSMYNDHPVASQLAIDALTAWRDSKLATEVARNLKPLEDRQRDVLKEAREFIILNAADIKGGPARRVIDQIDEILTETTCETPLRWK